MSPGVLHPHSRSRPGGVPADQRTAGSAGPTADMLGFSVDWQVGVGSSEADAATTAVEPPAPKARPRSEFSFTIARALGTVVVSARGPLDDRSSRTLRDVLTDLIENQGNMTVVVDLHDMTDVDPACLDIFVAAHGLATIRGGHLSLTGARDQVGRALNASGVARLVKVTADRILVVPAR